jgi:Skp family chaperone for outer membrane proteins
MKTIKFAIIVLFIGTGLVQAATSLNIGVVDLQKVLFYYDEFKILRIEYANRSSRYESELNEMEKELEKLKERIQDPALAEKKKQGLESDFSRQMFNLQRKYEQYKKKLDDSKQADLDKLKAVVFKEIGVLARKKRLDYVLDQKQLYFGNVLDFTEELIERLNSGKVDSKGSGRDLSRPGRK